MKHRFGNDRTRERGTISVILNQHIRLQAVRAVPVLSKPIFLVSLIIGSIPLYLRARAQRRLEVGTRAEYVSNINPSLLRISIFHLIQIQNFISQSELHKGNKFCRWSIEPVPPCASICRPTQAPEAPYGTDLDLLGVIPIKDNQTVLVLLI